MTNLVDRVVGYFDPKAQVERSRARAILVKRRYEGASKADRFKGWQTVDDFWAERGSAGAQNTHATLRARSRYLAANNPYAKRGIKAIASHVVGKGIIPQIKSVRHEEILKAWADTTACDKDARHDLYGLEYIVMKTIVEAGECLIVRRPQRASDGVLPIKIEVLEPDFLDMTRVMNGANHVVSGIEFDRDGRRVAYWIFPAHPAERLGTSLVSNRIPAANVIHTFEMLRPGQVRGLPWITPVIVRLKDFDEFEDARLVREKLGAALVGFVQDMQFSPTMSDEEIKEFREFRPGSFEILPPGKTITFSNPPSTQGYREFAETALHAIAAGLEVPFEVLTGNYSNVNYSSARLAFLEFYRSIDHWRHHVLIPQVLTRVMDWFLDAVELMGLADGRPPVTWTPPRRELIDPEKDNAAIKDAVRCGFIPLSQAIREYGNDPEDVMKEIAADNKALDRLGLTLDTDPRKGGTPNIAHP